MGFIRWCLGCLLLIAGGPTLHGNAEPMSEGTKPKEEAIGNVSVRAGLKNARIQFTKNKTGHVAFLGGSITEMNGYRPLVCESLVRRFPGTKFTFTNAGIASTCSTTGAFRLAADVLDKGPVDLLFVEFAVNDDQDAHHSREECIRGMEGIVRHLWKHNPNADMVISYFVNPEMIQTIKAGKTPLTISSHEEVARTYQVPSVNVAQELVRRMQLGQITWQQYGGVHPARPGNELAARLVDEVLNQTWNAPLPADAAQRKHVLPDKPLEEGNYENGRLVDVSKAKLTSGWKVETPDWSKLAGDCRERFRKQVLLCADKPGAELTLKFEGKGVGVYVLAGPDAGIVEAAVDERPFRPFDLYHAFSGGLHYPRTVVFADDLKPGRHTLKLRLTDKHNPGSKGTAARVLYFVAN